MNTGFKVKPLSRADVEQRLRRATMIRPVREIIHKDPVDLTPLGLGLYDYSGRFDHTSIELGDGLTPLLQLHGLADSPTKGIGAMGSKDAFLKCFGLAPDTPTPHVRLPGAWQPIHAESRQTMVEATLAYIDASHLEKIQYSIPAHVVQSIFKELVENLKAKNEKKNPLLLHAVGLMPRLPQRRFAILARLLTPYPVRAGYNSNSAAHGLAANFGLHMPDYFSEEQAPLITKPVPSWQMAALQAAHKVLQEKRNSITPIPTERPLNTTRLITNLREAAA